MLSIQPAHEYPRASQNVEAMLEMGRALEKKGLAYAQHGSLYFDISKFPSYGHLSRVDLRKIRVGLTVDLDDYEKDNPRDFTLFKRSTLAELKQGISYTSPWGQVRPGWHIECAAMASRLLGETIDIHTSGSALMFPHHENEIAICESLSGKTFCRYWIHSERVLLDGKSVSGRMTLKDLLSRGFKGREIRFILIGTHYRKPLHFSIQSLHAARKSLARLDRLVFRLRWSKGEGGKKEVSDWIFQAREDFESAMDDDLNVSVALAAIFRLAKQLNPALEEGGIGLEQASQALRFLESVNNVLQILELEACFPREGEILELIAKREKARKRRDWVEADRIREELSSMGVILVDTPSGTRWIPKSSD